MEAKPANSPSQSLPGPRQFQGPSPTSRGRCGKTLPGMQGNGCVRPVLLSERMATGLKVRYCLVDASPSFRRGFASQKAEVEANSPSERLLAAVIPGALADLTGSVREAPRKSRLE